MRRLGVGWFGRLDAIGLALAEQECPGVSPQELTGLRLADIQSIVVDQLHLPVQPFVPAGLADVLLNAPAQVIAEGRCVQAGPQFSTATAFDLGHDSLCLGGDSTPGLSQALEICGLDGGRPGGQFCHVVQHSVFANPERLTE